MNLLKPANQLPEYLNILVLALFLLLLTDQVDAQITGKANLDPAFRQAFSLYGGEVTALATQSDGKILVAGVFERIRSGGTVAPGPLLRLNANGTIDSSFQYASSGNRINALLVQPDGKIIVGIRDGRAIERLLPDGSRDPAFPSYTSFFYRSVTDLRLQPDGKIIAIGLLARRDFDPEAEPGNNGIIRFNSDGSVDRTFNAGGKGAVSVEYPPAVQAIAIQPDGRILIGGVIEKYNETPLRSLARLNADGTLDGTFNPAAGTDGTVQSLALQADGKILVGGAFQNVNLTPRNRMARLEANGSLDATFNPNAITFHAVLFPFILARILPLPGGKILIAGTFQTTDGTAFGNVARLNPDGSLDSTFTVVTTDPVRDLVRQADGKLILGGLFTRAGNETHFSLARLQVNGELDRDFNPVALQRGKVLFLANAPEGRVVVVGNFDVVGTADRPSIVRLNRDGSIDESFKPTIDILFPTGMVVQPDGKIILAAIGLNGAGYQQTQGLIRLRVDGSLDHAYDVRTGGLPSPAPLALQPDGKLLATIIPSTTDRPAHFVTRFNSDGSVDTGFRTSLSDAPRQILAHPDGGIILRFNGLDTTILTGFIAGAVTRLRAEGTNDPDFTTFLAALGPIALEPGNRLIVPYSCFNAIGSTIWQTVALPTKNKNPGIPSQPCAVAFWDSNPVGPYLVLPDRTIFSPSSNVAQRRMADDLLQVLQTEIGLFGTTAVLRESDGGILIAGNGVLVRGRFPGPAYTPSVSLAVTSAANFKLDVAAGSLVAVFGKGLSASTIQAKTPSTILGETSAILVSADGQEKELILLYVSDGQINAQIPDSFPTGQATLVVLRDGQAIGSTLVNIRQVAPGIFTASGTGRGYAAAQIFRVRADGSRGYEPVVMRDASGQIVPRPIDLGPEGEAVYLVLFGTGIRHHSGTWTAPGNAVKAEVSLPSGAVSAAVTYAGEAPGLLGLDQVNILIPRSLKGIGGDVTFSLTVDGLLAAATIQIL